MLVLAANVARAGEIAFVRHDIDRSCAMSAAAAIDVDHDGRLDIVTGRTWYEAPASALPDNASQATPRTFWKPHPVRDVEFIRGRYDDYGCLPLDVNADGWTDFIIANYRSSKLGWVEHPGKSLGAWTEHVVEKPGPMETGRLVDLDGDGQLDVIPSGKDFAAWWEIVPGTEPRWVRHDLPQELAGHGIGWGDVNGDGRIDVVGEKGWAEAPADRRAGRWHWHAEFDLGTGASVPIVVTDVDGDGDADLVWGRAHRTGLYWLERLSASDSRAWQEHAIDSSWAQPHTVELADLDGDGRAEIVSGRRYLAHDGRDVGEWDPLAIYAYRFDSKLRTWHRSTISDDGQAGFDVDPKLVDLDKDGDLDLVCPGRNGLCWLENVPWDPLSRGIVNAPQIRDHSKLLVYLDEGGAEQPVKTPADWGRRRADILVEMQRVMGPLPDSSLRVPLDVKELSSTDEGKYQRRKISYATEPGDRVPAWLLVPHQRKGRAAAMLCLHQTTKIGKDEPAGLDGKPNLHYAHELAERGFVCLVPDYPSFGEYPYDFRQTGAHASGSIKAVWNNVRGIDLLAAMSEVDRDKIGVIGHSLGGHNALFTAAFDQRIRAVVTSCGFTPFHDYYGGKLAGWTSDRYMPRIRDAFDSNPDRVPFDFYEVVAAVAPRAMFTNSPERDANFDVGGVRKAITAAGQVYELFGARDKLVAAYPDCEHDFPEDVRKQAYDWLGKMMSAK